MKRKPIVDCLAWLFFPLFLLFNLVWLPLIQRASLKPLWSLRAIMSGLQPTQPDASSRSAAGETASDTISGQTDISTARPSVSIPVLLFASLRDAARADQIVVQVECQRTHCAGQNAAITVAALLEHCALQYPQLAPWLPHIRVAVNCEYADNECLIVPGDEVALLPPVSGGASR